MAKGGGQQEEADESIKKAQQYQGTASAVLAQLILEVKGSSGTSRHDKICRRIKTRSEERTAVSRHRHFRFNARVT